VDAAVWYLQLDPFEPEQILERRLREAIGLALRASQPSADDERSTLPTGFLESLAADSPAPGGGSASAYSGAAGAALVAMVARLTIGRKKYAEVETQMQQVLARAEALRAELTAAIQQDAAAFEAVMAAYRLSKGTLAEEAARAEAIESAMKEAARVPLRVATQAVEVMGLAVQVVRAGNLNAISDGASAAAQARAALSGAGYNVRINAASLKDQEEVKRLFAALKGLEEQAAEYEADLRAALSGRGGMLL
jgi:glutamate formiminotransferase/formiminotetrahydrofolate cyclodeaminase